ncbi:MAG: hypothetical protein ACM3KE_11235 [Hyphomicrobiales bacterium]
MDAPFKICPFCATVWPSREAFLNDNDLELIGYQVDFEELALGLLLFNHDPCKTTLAIRALQLRDLYRGPVFKDRRTGQEDCPGHCLRNSELAPCPTACECAWVRGLLQVVREWPKSASIASSKAANRT